MPRIYWSARPFPYPMEPMQYGLPIWQHVMRLPPCGLSQFLVTLLSETEYLITIKTTTTIGYSSTSTSEPINYIIICLSVYLEFCILTALLRARPSSPSKYFSVMASIYCLSFIHDSFLLPCLHYQPDLSPQPCF